MGTETSGHWIDTVDRQRVCSEMLGHWFDTIGRQRRFGHWSLIRHSRSSVMGTKTFGYWLDTVDCQRGILRRLVSGWTQEIASEGNFYDVWSLVRYITSSESGSEMFGHLLVDRCAERGC